MLNPQGFVAECTGENIFVVRHGTLITPPLTRAPSRASPRASVMAIAARPRLRGARSATSPAATSTSPRRCSCAAPPPRSAPVNSVDDRADPVPGPDDHGDRRGVRARPSAARSTDTRTGSNMSERMPAPSRSSTRPCATAPSSRASRSPSTTSCASPSSSTSSASLDRGRLARRQPEGRGVLPAGRAPSCSSTTSTLVAFGSTRRVKGKVDDDPTLAQPGRGRHVHGVHRRQVLGLPRHRGAADHPRRGRGHGGRLGASSCAARASA